VFASVVTRFVIVLSDLTSYARNLTGGLGTSARSQRVFRPSSFSVEPDAKAVNGRWSRFAHPNGRGPLLLSSN